MSSHESLQAERVLKEQKLLVDNEYRSGRVVLTSTGVQCVEEHGGYWSRMTTNNNKRELGIQIGILGNVTGQNIAIQSKKPKQYSCEFSQVSDSDIDILALAMRIQKLVISHSECLEHPEQVERDAKDLVAELEQPEQHRDKDRIRDTMKRLATRVSAASALAEAVSKLWSMLFG